MPVISFPFPATVIDRSILTAHPAGVNALFNQQVAQARLAFPTSLPEAEGKTALILGSTSFGYGSSMAVALREAGFNTIIGIGYEQPFKMKDDTVRIAPTGRYVIDAMHRVYPGTRTYIADAFSDATRDRVIADLLASDTKVDLLAYSLAAPRRSHGGQTWSSAIKVLGDPLTLPALELTMRVKNFDEPRFRIKNKTVPVATREETEGTRRVMGGEDLDLWVSHLIEKKRFSAGAKVAAMSYIGPNFMPLRRIYWDGTLGRAKRDVDFTTARLTTSLKHQVGGEAFSVVAPAVVTTASVVIDGIMSYMALYLGAAARGIGRQLRPIDVATRLVRALYGANRSYQELFDHESRLRVDREEMDPILQDAIQTGWNAAEEGEPQGMMLEGARIFATEYKNLFGWDVEGIDYDAAVEVEPTTTEETGLIDLTANRL